VAVPDVSLREGLLIYDEVHNRHVANPCLFDALRHEPAERMMLKVERKSETLVLHVEGNRDTSLEL
jgi:hypothetical protein